MTDKEHYIQLIVEKIWSAFSHAPRFVLDVGKAITEKAEQEIKFNVLMKHDSPKGENICSERNNDNDQ